MCLQVWAELVRPYHSVAYPVSFQSVSGPQVAARIAVSEQVRRNFLSDSYTILPATYSLVPPSRRRPKISRTYRPISIHCSIRQTSSPIGQFTVVITPPRANREQLDRYPAGPSPSRLTYQTKPSSFACSKRLAIALLRFPPPLSLPSWHSEFGNLAGAVNGGNSTSADKDRGRARS
jgi:hypothetical protein